MLLAELLFLYSCPRRKNFVIRAAASVLIVVAASYFFPLPAALIYSNWYALVRQLVLFALTIGTAYATFDLPLEVTLFTCVGGSAVQHIGYRCAGLLSATPVLSAYANEVFPRDRLLEVIAFLLVYVLVYFIFGRTAAKNEYYKNTSRKFNYIAIVVILLCNLISRLPRQLGEQDSVCVALYDIISCVLTLVLQFSLYEQLSVQAEKNTMQNMWSEERKQYEITKQTIDAINIKCHDMKHKLYHSDVLREEGEDIKSLIHIYDNSVKTGSKVLDVILMDYGLRYGGENITFTFMGNGACLDFMKESDLYSLFGNALSNAAEAVMRLSDGEKKTVSVTVNQKGDFVTVNVNNYYAGELSFHGELPKTSKANKDQSHGFGVKSMQLLAKKYGGELRIAAEGGIFRLNIYFMRPKSAER
jgi:hypothetical protein